MATLPKHFQSRQSGAEQVSREVLASHQRERVLELVTGVFAKRGYDGTTVDDLLATGKVGVGNFYSLFKGKEDCFLAALERVVERGGEQIGAATADSEDWTEQTYLGLHAAIAFLIEHPLEARLVLVEAQSAGAEALRRHNELIDTATGWLRGGREHFPAARELPAGFEQAAVSGLAFYLQQCLLDSRRHKTDELFGEAAQLVLEPIVSAAELRRLAGALSAQPA